MIARTPLRERHRWCLNSFLPVAERKERGWLMVWQCPFDVRRHPHRRPDACGRLCWRPLLFWAVKVGASAARLSQRSLTSFLEYCQLCQSAALQDYKFANDFYLHRINVLSGKPNACAIAQEGHNANVVDTVTLIAEFCDGDIGTAGPHVETAPKRPSCW